jgi:Asp-tRNA(Asn)/Glu-tRNA(Gln) amidotransferase A subunit family amidase
MDSEQRGWETGLQEVELDCRNASELVEALAGGAVSAVELAEAAIARIDRSSTTTSTSSAMACDATLPGLPATVLPIGASAEGLPVRSTTG